MNGTAAAAGAIGGLAMIILLLAFVFWILLIVARWKMFSKADEAGWKSIIPIYADYVQWRIGWQKTGLFWGYIALVIVGSILMSMGGLTADQIAGTAAVTSSSITNPIFVYGGAIVMLAGYIIALVGAYKLFQSFGYGIGFFILYIILPPIALLVLGFGSAQWQGPRP